MVHNKTFFVCIEFFKILLSGGIAFKEIQGYQIQVIIQLRKKDVAVFTK
jgi:hypothetical protein